jgi:hypothetical protein
MNINRLEHEWHKAEERLKLIHHRLEVTDADCPRDQRERQTALDAFAAAIAALKAGRDAIWIRDEDLPF